MHIDDLVGLLAEAVANDQYTGVYNGTAPNPVRMNDLCASIGEVRTPQSLMHACSAYMYCFIVMYLWRPPPVECKQTLVFIGKARLVRIRTRQYSCVCRRKGNRAGYQFQALLWSRCWRKVPRQC